jgi:hypothetical protein
MLISQIFWQDYLGEILAWVICLIIYFPHWDFWDDNYRHIIVLWARGPWENDVIPWFNWINTIIYKDNWVCVVQMETGYIRSNINKHIAPKLFYHHELQENGDINILQTKSCDNLTDLFKKSLPYSTFSEICWGDWYEKT